MTRVNWEYALLLAACAPYLHAIYTASLAPTYIPAAAAVVVDDQIALRNSTYSGNVSACSLSHPPVATWNALVFHLRRLALCGICEQHLDVPRPCRACLVGAVRMRNPVIVGRSKELGRFRQSKLGAANHTVEQRPVAVVVTWLDDGVDGLEFGGRFSGPVAACMAMLVEEFNPSSVSEVG